MCSTRRKSCSSISVLRIQFFTMNPISINYSYSNLRILVDEYITRQRNSFTLQGVCSYVLYWAMETGHTAGVPTKIYESDKLQADDCDRVHSVLSNIADEGRIAAVGDHFKKMNN